MDNFIFTVQDHTTWSAIGLCICTAEFLLLVHSWSTSRLILWHTNWKHSSSHISLNIVLTYFLSQIFFPPYSPALFFPVSPWCHIPLFHSLIPCPFSWTCILTCLSYIYFLYSEDAGTRFLRNLNKFYQTTRCHIPQRVFVYDVRIRFYKHFIMYKLLGM